MLNVKVQEKRKLDNKITTLLHYGCIYGNTLILEFLLHNGANINEIDEENLKPVDLSMMLNKV